MFSVKLSILGLLQGILLCTFLPNFANAQQTIFNVPSADITAKNQFFLEHESQFKPNNPNAFYASTTYATYGIGHEIELNATQFNISSPASHNASLGLGFKAGLTPELLKLSHNPSQYQPKLILGAMMPISLQNQGVGNWIYAQPSVYLPEIRTRLTGGITSGTKQIFGKKIVGFLGGVEKEVSSDFSLIADWYSGKHAMGILTAGFSYKFPRNWVIFFGLNRANSKRFAGNGATIEIGKTF